MKKQILKRIAKSMLIVAMAMLVVVACKKDETTDDPGTTPVEDGIYVTGAATGVATPGIKGLMKTARNEVTQEDRADLKEIYMAVSATDGFNIVMVSGSTTTTYGPGADFAEVTELDGDEPTFGLWRGALVESADKFTVPADGLYHIAFDKELMIVVIAKVEWGLIGAATPGGWTDDTPLPSAGFDFNSMTFEATNVKMTKSNWKFRYSGGWKIILDADYDIGEGKTGIKVNCNFGTAVDALVAGGTDIDNETAGYYTATMTWTLGAGHSASMVKTADIEIFNYTNTEFGLVGDGIVWNDTVVGWNTSVMVDVPVVDGTNYTWTYEGVEVDVAGSFKIREGQDWTGLSFGYPQLVWAGLSQDKFGDDGTGNIKPLENGTYDMELLIDAANDVYTFTVNPSGAVIPELYMVGDGTAAGWDIDNPIPMDGTGGVYTITTDLPGAGGIKFVTTPGAWQPQYGTDATGTWESGPLFVNDGTGSDPDPVPGPAAAGTYTINVNTNTMTYSVVAAK